MALGTVTFRSDLLSPAKEIGFGNTALTLKMSVVSGAFPKKNYGIKSVFLDMDILKSFGDRRQMIVRNGDGSLLGNLWVGDAGFQRWELNRDISYEGLSRILADGGSRPSCVIRGGTYIYIYVNWETIDAEIIDPPIKFPSPVVKNDLKTYPTAGEAIHSTVAVSFDGVDISDPINQDLLTMTYTDNEEDEADDLQIKIHDKSKKWLGKWLNDTMQQASFGTKQGTKGLTISAGVKQYRDGKIKSGDFGLFELDSIKASGPPSSIIIKGTSLPFSGIRTDEKNKNWEGYTLKGIGMEIARNGGLGFVYDCPADPLYARIEQSEQTDISFLMQLCHDNGYSLKISGMKLIIFDQNRYEQIKSAAVISWEDGSYTKYELQTQSGETHYDKVNLIYYDASGAKKYTATAVADDYDDEASEHTICTITNRKVHSAAAAGDLARQILRLHNKYERKVTFTLIGNPILGAGMTIELKGFGLWDDKYIIKTCKHEISQNGYTTKVTLRTIPEGKVTTIKTESGEKNAVSESSDSANTDGSGGSGTNAYGYKSSSSSTPNLKATSIAVYAGLVTGLSAVTSAALSLAAASEPVSKGGGSYNPSTSMVK